MKRYLNIIVPALLLVCSCSSGVSVFGIRGNVETCPVPDTVSVLRNPCCGWGLYDDADGEVSDAAQYWEKQDEASKYASFFYLRWRWSDMEPEEGRYAWLYDDNYKALIQGALDRGLRLAFRIYFNGKDNLHPGTPDYVRKAGAGGCVVGDHWTPYIDDPVFQEKLEAFIRAFALEYDNPAIVDFVDGVNAGWWGECHHLNLRNPDNRDEVLQWFTDTYGKAFGKVPLIMPVCSEFGFENEMRVAVGRNGYGFRRDGLGSRWFNPSEKANVRKLFPGTLLIGESCYWKGDLSDTPHFYDDMYKFKSWREVLEATYNDAVSFHFNTLDLRQPLEAQRWLEKAPDLVTAFIRNGGYRIAPKVISAPSEMRNGRKITIAHRWENTASGYFPNTNRRWNYKYRVAFALLDAEGNPCRVFVDRQSDPSEFLKGHKVDYFFNIEAEGIAPGTYTWATSIIDVSGDNLPSIRLAAEGGQQGQWLRLNEVRIR